MEVAVIALRWLQYSGAVVLFGAPLFLLYSFKGTGSQLGWARPVLMVAAIVIALASLAALVAQTAVMAGSLSEALKPASLSFMVTGTGLGMAMVVRVAVALVALVAVVTLKPGRALWSLMIAAGLIVAASFAWTGHGAATEGPLGLFHLAAAIVHAVAAAMWLGALAALTILLLRRTAPDAYAIHSALHGFAGLGSVSVGLLVLTGIVNGWFLVGPERVAGLGANLYGQLLVAKLVLFAVMFALAAVNRLHLTPQLGSTLSGGDDSGRALQRLRRSVTAETLAGALLLAVVAVMGTLAPPSSM